MTRYKSSVLQKNWCKSAAICLCGEYRTKKGEKAAAPSPRRNDDVLVYGSARRNGNLCIRPARLPLCGFEVYAAVRQERNTLCREQPRLRVPSGCGASGVIDHAVARVFAKKFRMAQRPSHLARIARPPEIRHHCRIVRYVVTPSHEIRSENQKSANVCNHQKNIR